MKREIEIVTVVGNGRQQFKHKPNCKFVGPDEYLRLATSRQTLVRSDEPVANLRGLVDLITGTRFLAKEEELVLD